MIVESLTKDNSGAASLIGDSYDRPTMTGFPCTDHDIMVVDLPLRKILVNGVGMTSHIWKVKMFQTTKHMISYTVYLVRRYDNHWK